MASPWQELLGLHAVIGAFVIFWSLIDHHLPTLSNARRQLGAGMLMGVTACATMFMAVEVKPGFIFDLRHALISVSGLLFGPVAAFSACALTGFLRIYQGGAGMNAGLLGIAISTSIGATGYYILKQRPPTLIQCTFFAMAVSIGVLLSLLAIPAASRSEIVSQIWLPLLTLTFTSTLFTALLLAAETRRKDDTRSLELYREMVDALPDCLNAKDLNGRFLVANEATAKLMKAKSASDLIGKSDFDFYPRSVAAGFREDEANVLAAGTVQQIEQLVDFDDGKIGWLDTIKIPFRNREGRVNLITYNRDTTHLHEINEMKEQFISTVSHEIRTPLTSICGSLRLISHKLADELPEKAMELLSIAERNAQQLKELINNVLDLEKFHAGQMEFTPEAVDIRQITEEAVESVRHYLPNKSLSWKVNSPGAQVFAQAHPVRLRQVLMNLLSNAAKFAPSGSMVEIEISFTQDLVQLCVLDSGPGVQPEFEAMLFARFKQDNSTAALTSKNGTGLGLSLIKSFVEHMSGTVSYRRRGCRTEFCVELPRCLGSPMGTIEKTCSRPNFNGARRATKFDFTDRQQSATAGWPAFESRPGLLLHGRSDKASSRNH